MSLRVMGQALSTMHQLQKKLDTVSHNIANSNTVGYKSRKAEFSSMLFQEINNMTNPRNAEGRLTPDGIRIGSGAKLGSIQSHLALGSMQTTERALDTMLLNENHFYQVRVTDGTEDTIRYTKDGMFYLHPVNNNADVILVNKDGHPVLGENGPIQFNAQYDAIQIEENGSIVVSRGSETEVVGNLTVVEAVRPHLLEAIGENLFRLPDLGALGYNFGEVIQATNQNERLIKSGVIENSNVDMGEEMTDLMVAQRSYQFNARSISMADQMQGLVNQIRS